MDVYLYKAQLYYSLILFVLLGETPLSMHMLKKWLFKII